MIDLHTILKLSSNASNKIKFIETTKMQDIPEHGYCLILLFWITVHIGPFVTKF